jgi:multidrug efflux pump subunit AcrB
MGVDLTNPELTLTVKRDRALIEGVSSGQIGAALRTALFGKEVSKIKEGKDEYKIQLRNNEFQRKNLVELLNMKISFRDMASGGAIKNIPISSLVTIEPTCTFGCVKI